MVGTIQDYFSYRMQEDPGFYKLAGDKFLFCSSFIFGEEVLLFAEISKESGLPYLDFISVTCSEKEQARRDAYVKQKALKMIKVSSILKPATPKPDPADPADLTQDPASEDTVANPPF